MFYRHLENVNVYFEYGSGGSTYQASIRNNIKYIYSVESDPLWHQKLQQVINNPNTSNIIFNEMDTRPRSAGYIQVNVPPKHKKQIIVTR